MLRDGGGVVEGVGGCVFFFFFFEFWKEVEVEPSPSSSVEKNQMALPQQCRIFSRPRKVVCEP